MRHWSLTRMLCCPARLPFKASNRLPGGRDRSRSSRERSSCVSFLKATRSICGGRPWSRRRCHNRSVFRQAKLAITRVIYRSTIICQAVRDGQTVFEPGGGDVWDGSRGLLVRPEAVRHPCRKRPGVVNEVSVSQQLARRDRHFLHAGNNPERANAAQAPAPLGVNLRFTPFERIGWLAAIDATAGTFPQTFFASPALQRSTQEQRDHWYAAAAKVKSADRLVASGFRIAQQHFVGTNSLKESWGLPLLLEPPKGGRMKAECRMQNTEPAPQVPQTLRLKPTSWDRLQTAPRPTPDCLQITPGMQKNEEQPKTASDGRRSARFLRGSLRTGRRSLEAV